MPDGLAHVTRSSMEKMKQPRWTQITLQDGACLLYWGLLGVTILTMMGRLSDTYRWFGIVGDLAKFASVLALWILGISISQICLNEGSLLKGICRAVFVFPISVSKVLVGFLWDSNKLRKKLKTYPVRTVFFLTLPITVIVGLTNCLAFLSSDIFSTAMKHIAPFPFG